MRKLSDTIARLAALKAAQRQVSHRAPRNRLKDMELTGANPGALKASTFVPDNLASGRPLVVALHGCTQSAAAYDEGSGWSDLADRYRFALLFPEQQRSNNANLCFNWFEPEDAKRDAGEALSIREMIETMVATHGLDRDRIFIVGLSAGGAMASVMLAIYPDVFAGGAIIAGLPFGSASSMPEAFDRMRGHGGPGELRLQKLVRDASPWRGKWPAISVWHGTADNVVDISNMEAIVRQWAGLHGVKISDYVSETEQGFLRKVWHGADGRECIESYTIPGMGHGTPLAAAGPDSYGKVGPFMLESGVSSTLRIATFWGLADAAHDRRGTETASQEYVHRGEILVPGALTDKLQEEGTGRRFGTKNAHAAGIQKTIEDALRAAGLIK
ncbi:poly(hydroxyalkanoate) depolymerase family esterase [Mycoplana sp. BE70]|uniref:extracellular catalytic domain type 1 short-chain-length polyhydroxyalkanoate depolymerase n=1 Tax=Mycoplana sp. BE70 TaxID=2817775 RepID=UPI00285A7BEE|nr:PHB depolymerase family esterase [Mycoplana sp. BE70]MDR6758668.1 poly(hydroxyalkanoate) depolymerase family esterase [Mycoplana sp. BE70]